MKIKKPSKAWLAAEAKKKPLPFPNEVADLFHVVRKMLKIRQTWMADKLGLTQAAISRIESEFQTATPDQLFHLGRIAHKSPEVADIYMRFFAEQLCPAIKIERRKAERAARKEERRLAREAADLEAASAT